MRDVDGVTWKGQNMCQREEKKGGSNSGPRQLVCSFVSPESDKLAITSPKVLLQQRAKVHITSQAWIRDIYSKNGNPGRKM